MPKIKIKEWKGIYTNLDENDAKLEFAQDSINWRHDRGFLQIEPRYLTEYTLPNLNGYGTYDWEWETGIYCILANDPLKATPVGTKYDGLVLIAKVLDGDIYHRLIFFKDLTNDTPWYDMCSNGNLPSNPIQIYNHDGAGDFTGSFFSTTTEGDAFFRSESGRLHIYFPHDCFWLGRLERTFYHPSADPVVARITTNNWYLDRLVEPFDNRNYDINLGVFQDSGDRICAPGRRLGITFDISTEEDPEVIVESNALSLSVVSGYPQPVRPNDTGGTDLFLTWGITARYTKDGTEITSFPSYPVSVSTLEGKIWIWLANDMNGYNNDDHFEDHYTTLPEWPNPYIWFPTYFLNYIKIYDSLGNIVDITTVATYDETASIAKFNSGGLYINEATEFAIAGYYMRFDDFMAANWYYVGAADIETVGFDASYEKLHYAITQVLDEREELVVKAGTFYPEVTVSYAIEISNLYIPEDINRRVTRTRFYLKFPDYTDYELVKEFEHNNPSEILPNEFYITERDLTSITLSQNIGIALDEEKPHLHKVITGFKDFVTESGVSIAIKSDDYINVYHSSLGGGNLMPDLIYTQNILPVYGASIINAVTSINKNLAAFSDNSMYLLKIAQETGLLVFTLDATLEFGVKDFGDVAPIQGGVAINTIHGIYTTTGYQSTLISEPIDDLVKANFATSRIYYNKYKHELFYKPTIGEDLYRFRFKDGVWECLNKTTTVESKQQYETQ